MFSFNHLLMAWGLSQFLVLSVFFFFSIQDHFIYFFKFKFIYFNWRLITLQYCIGFAIHQHESATGVHVFPILNHHHHPHFPPHTIPLGHPSAPAPSNLYPALNLDWAIHFLYDIIHVSMPFSQIIPCTFCILNFCYDLLTNLINI